MASAHRLISMTKFGKGSAIWTEELYAAIREDLSHDLVKHAHFEKWSVHHMPKLA